MSNDPQMDALRQFFVGLAGAPSTRDEAIALLAILPEPGDNERAAVRRYLALVRDCIRDRFPDVTKAEVRAFFVRIRDELPTKQPEMNVWLAGET